MPKEIDLLDEKEFIFEKKRPIIITVLAILTFIGSGIYIIKGFLSWVALRTVNKFLDNVADDGMNQEFDKYMKWTFVSQMVEVISCLVVVLGAVLMLKMRITGYYVYVVGNIIFAIEISWYNIVISKMNINEISVLLIVAQLALPIGFVILYGLNTKYLKADGRK